MTTDLEFALRSLETYESRSETTKLTALRIDYTLITAWRQPRHRDCFVSFTTDTTKLSVIVARTTLSISPHYSVL